MISAKESALLLVGSHFHPDDESHKAEWLDLYGHLYDVAREVDARRIVEIGTRRGYSALTFCLSCPQAIVLTIEADLDELQGANTHGGTHGAWKHAEGILSGQPALILLANSHDLDRLPTCDLVFIDGEHTESACLADLLLAAQSARHILADDYHSKDIRGRSLGVHEAVNAFMETHHADWIGREVKGSGRLYLASRRSSPEF